MCDSCGRIFSENEDGWATGAIQAMKRGPDGGMRPVTTQQDACPECNPAGRPVEMRPRIDLGPRQIKGGKGGSTAAEIAKLEQELGINNPGG
jgi:hypothetical protein